MPGRYEDITNADFTLTEPSQIIGGKPEGGELSLAPLRKPRPGQSCFDLSLLLIAKAGQLQKGVPSALITCGIREGKLGLSILLGEFPLL